MRQKMGTGTKGAINKETRFYPEGVGAKRFMSRIKSQLPLRKITSMPRTA